MIHCIVVDDEPLARNILAQHLSRLPNWKMQRECINAAEAWQAIQELEIQVMFLDIQMPGISGLELLRSLKCPPVVILTTAYSHYAVEGFDLKVADYLLKPITFERFTQAIVKAQEVLASPVVTIQEQASGAVPLVSDHLFLKIDNRHIRLNFEELLYFEAQRDFTKIFLQDKTLLAGLHLKLLENMLPESLFARVHRSYIINKRKISGIEGNRILIGKREVPIGTHYKDTFFRWMGL
ncbi:LytTR family DNA-binding domain-containing protein [Niabella sp. CC-SYL272]|uniref:LytR/AlgR family response regulator transcription factor n=1 Tax=Niabella agricola TaxID=2891571 RepID=UPI001F3D2EFE|nr:LytTR family DNA-binding domain-containing protein [Niabella agricola]MCF3108258.1 LytTR family DNA-binding domain-containing protein [Niabella agricola]